jgi:uncharacterized protein YcfL
MKKLLILSLLLLAGCTESSRNTTGKQTPYVIDHEELEIYNIVGDIPLV